MKCFVCKQSKEANKFEFTPNLSMRIIYICNRECYDLYIQEYLLCEMEVTLDKMEKRLKLYREKGGK